jgi:inorganic pyrophosphatase
MAAKTNSERGTVANMVAVEPFATSRTINVVVETPKGCRNKFKFNERMQRFVLGKVLPVGASFPYDFGFVPGTRAEDGDPFDVLLLMEESAFPGCVVEARPIGVLQAEQLEHRRTTRNDRILAVAVEGQLGHVLHSMRDLPKKLRDELVHFFESYNEAEGKQFRVIAQRGPREALSAIRKSITRTC